MNSLVGATVVLVAVLSAPYATYLAVYVALSPTGSPAEKEGWEPSVSVVLPTYNEELIVEGKLEGICSWEYPEEKMEVVVVDSSDDKTPALVRDFFADRETPILKLIEEEERRGVARAVNKAMKRVKSDVVFRTDCDSELAPDALREAVANLADDDIGGVTGRQAEVLGDSDVEAEYRDLLARVQAVESRLDSTFICHGPCFAFRTDSFRPLAPDSLADDTEIGVGIRRGGERVVMDPEVKFFESGVSAFGERRIRKDRRAMGLVQLLFRNRDLLGRAGRYGRIVLPFNYWFMVLSPWLAVAIGFLMTLVAVTAIGLGAIIIPASALVFVWLGQRDILGPLQPLYSVVDAEVSLLIAQFRLTLGDVTGTWNVDRGSREKFE